MKTMSQAWGRDSATRSWRLAIAIALAACDAESVGPASSGSGGTGGSAPVDEDTVVCDAKPGHKPTAIYGGDRTMLAVMDDGTLYCWRENGTGQCDIEEFGQLFSFPVRVPKLPCVTKAAAGNVGIAMTARGSAFTWGLELSDERGEGDGSSPFPNEPTRLPLKGVTDVSASDTAMGAIADAEAYRWGQTQERFSLPTVIEQASVASIAVDVPASCLLKNLRRRGLLGQQ